MNKKLIMFYVVLTVVMCSIQGLAASKNSPHYMQFIPESYNQHVGKYIFVLTMDNEKPYKGICMAFGNIYVMITINNLEGVKIMSIPHNRIIRIWQVK